MINGRFVVTGSPNYLMATYGLGYSFTVTVNIDKVRGIDKARQAILDRLPSAEYIDGRETSGDKKCWQLSYKVLNVKGGRTLEDTLDS
jgi:hypothetical protein